MSLEGSVLTTSQLQPQSSGSGISVIARIRPSLPGERLHEFPLIQKDQNEVVACDPQNRQLTSRHPFDAVFGPESHNIDVFQPLVQNLYNVLCGLPLLQINYGVTSSGKTYTLFGTPQEPGLLLQSASYLMQQLPQAEFFVSAVQIYLNQVTDLLNETAKLQVLATQQDPLPKRVRVPFKTLQQLQQIVREALAQRETAQTRSNSESSRSHCLLYLTIRYDNQENESCFVDLAGSEPFQGGSSKQLQQESSFIRTSLLMLDRSIKDLKNLCSQNQQSVSFRSSLLTMCLRPYLQPKLSENRYQLPGSVSLILNLHGGLDQFYSNVQTLNLGLLTKEIKNYAKTPSRLGQLGQSVQNYVSSAKSVCKSSLVESTVDELIIAQADWETVQEQFLLIQNQLAQIQQESELEFILARKEAIKEMQELMEAQLEAQKLEYEAELEEKDQQIFQLK